MSGAVGLALFIAALVALNVWDIKRRAQLTPEQRALENKTERGKGGDW